LSLLRSAFAVGESGGGSSTMDGVSCSSAIIRARIGENVCVDKEWPRCLPTFTHVGDGLGRSPRWPIAVPRRNTCERVRRGIGTSQKPAFSFGPGEQALV
jgi:hypothetical protein